LVVSLTGVEREILDYPPPIVSTGRVQSENLCYFTGLRDLDIMNAYGGFLIEPFLN